MILSGMALITLIPQKVVQDPKVLNGESLSQRCSFQAYIAVSGMARQRHVDNVTNV